jgi:hypothetical protein
MFSILCYKGNTNQNYIESPSHPVRMAIYHQRQQQMLARMWGKKEPSYTVGGIADM